MFVNMCVHRYTLWDKWQGGNNWFKHVTSTLIHAPPQLTFNMSVIICEFQLDSFQGSHIGLRPLCALKINSKTFFYALPHHLIVEWPTEWPGLVSNPQSSASCRLKLQHVSRAWDQTAILKELDHSWYHTWKGNSIGDLFILTFVLQWCHYMVPHWPAMPRKSLWVTWSFVDAMHSKIPWLLTSPAGPQCVVWFANS